MLSQINRPTNLYGQSKSPHHQCFPFARKVIPQSVMEQRLSYFVSIRFDDILIILWYCIKTGVFCYSVKTEQVPGGADSVLRLARVNSSDAGNYTCAVRGARPHTVSVHVLNGDIYCLTRFITTEQVSDGSDNVLRLARVSSSDVG